MASLIELKNIMDNSAASPGDPANPDIVAARSLLGRIEAFLWRAARFYLNDPENDTTPSKMFLKWAVRTSHDSAAMARVALRLALGSAAAEAITAEQLLSITDEQLATGLTPIIPQLAHGTLLNRR